MLFTRAPHVLVALGTALFLATSMAASADGVITTLSGYGTVGGSFTSDSNYAYHHDTTEYAGASNRESACKPSSTSAQNFR